jgi:phosphatidylserine/phosphatidylglycerophosphate/cardiolipin synthase-like enzyme
LIAYTNRGGERNLRKLEMRLLDNGITVARTADDLARYHDKFMIIDRHELFVLSFNYTRLDIEQSRCFGLITRHPRLVAEAIKLFEADTKRQPYEPSNPGFIVSPVNARKQLGAFLQGAKKELLIYDPEVSDQEMLRILAERARAGVDIKVIGRVRGGLSAAARKLSIMRLHTRTIIRDRTHAFIGSQSLRELELSSRRELGITFRDKKIVDRLAKTFHDDWEAIEKAGPQPAQQVVPPQVSLDAPEQVARVAKKVAKAMTKDLPPVAPVLRVVVRELVGDALDGQFDNAVAQAVEENVKMAVKDAVRDAVEDAVETVVQQNGDASVNR